jgi:hypothetical protein
VLPWEIAMSVSDVEFLDPIYYESNWIPQIHMLNMWPYLEVGLLQAKWSHIGSSTPIRPVSLWEEEHKIDNTKEWPGETPGKETHLQTQEKTQTCQQLDLSLQNCEKINACYLNHPGCSTLYGGPKRLIHYIHVHKIHLLIFLVPVVLWVTHDWLGPKCDCMLESKERSTRHEKTLGIRSGTAE